MAGCKLPASRHSLTAGSSEGRTHQRFKPHMKEPFWLSFSWIDDSHVNRVTRVFIDNNVISYGGSYEAENRKFNFGIRFRDREDFEIRGSHVANARTLVEDALLLLDEYMGYKHSAVANLEKTAAADLAAKKASRTTATTTRRPSRTS